MNIETPVINMKNKRIFRRYFGGEKKKKKLGTKNMQFLLLSSPALLLFFVFAYIPMFGLILAFKSYRYDLGIVGSKWVGFKNFVFFFTSQDAFRVTRNTVGYGIVFIVLGTITTVVVAILLCEISKKIWINVFQTAMILPNFMSWVVVSFISYILLNPSSGVINHLLIWLGKEEILWFSEPKYWPYILTIAYLWKGLGMGSVVYYAALMGVDKELYEAAKMDGATKFQQTKYISIPMLIPLITLFMVLGIGNLFRGDFGLFYQLPMNVGMLYSATDVIDTYIYRALSGLGGDVGMSAAVGLFQSFVGLILVLFSNWIIKRVNPENAIF